MNTVTNQRLAHGAVRDFQQAQLLSVIDKRKPPIVRIELHLRRIMSAGQSFLTENVPEVHAHVPTSGRQQVPPVGKADMNHLAAMGGQNKLRCSPMSIPDINLAI